MKSNCNSNNLYFLNFLIFFTTITTTIVIEFVTGSIHQHYNHFDKTNKYVTDMKDVMDYFTEFGYMDSPAMKNKSGTAMSMEDIRDLVMDFQQVCSLKETGVLDEPTMKLMNTPRCANKDHVIEHHHHHGHGQGHNQLRPQRFTLHGSKWEQQRLTYRISQYSRQQITRQIIDEAIRRAFSIWENEINLEFIPSTSSQVDIDLRFVIRQHGDQYAFDGTYTLAHAFYPGSGLGGDVHFNDEVDWISSPSTLLFTAVHEIGHSLGLRHSSVQDSVMFAHYIWADDVVRLHSDDIEGVQQIYGSRAGAPNNNRPPALPPPRTQRPLFNQPPPRAPATAPPRTTTTTRTTTTALTTTTRAPPFTHKPVRIPPPVWPVNPPTTTATTTRPIIAPNAVLEENFLERRNSELCQNGRIDAIMKLNNGTILVFRKNFILPLNIINNHIEPGKIVSIEHAFHGKLPSSIDTAFTRQVNGKSYYFKHEKYWKGAGTEIEHGYPILIAENFPGIPNGLDAAFEWTNKLLYFFKGTQYWKFNPTTSPPVTTPDYPSLISDSNWDGLPTYDLDDVLQLGEEGQTFFFRNGRYWRFDERTGQVPHSASPPYPRDARIWFFGCTSHFREELSSY